MVYNSHPLSEGYGVFFTAVVLLILGVPAPVARAQTLSDREQELVRRSESQHLSAADEKRWLEAFKEWAQTQPPEAFFPRNTIEKRYREHLASGGLTPDQIDLRWGSILRTRQDDQDWGRLTGNKSYAAGYYEGVPPSRDLATFIEGKTPGKALDCEMGAGRNAVFLASRGWDVTGLDRSDVAVQRAEALASKAGVRIHAVRGLYQDFDWGHDQWDLIINVGSWDNAGRPNSTFSKAPLAGALKPGGFLYIENGTATMDWQRAFLERLFPGGEVVQRLVKADPEFVAARKVETASDRVIFTVRKPTAARR